mmetsp:Transcript_20946/g.34616  ORF Transcript_20946/g.34616 Transcript_20946/m.34616 type:complete len:495 (-) Transcript_20946:95-1579(-)
MMQRYATAALAALLMMGYLGIHHYTADENVVLMRRRLSDGLVDPENRGLSQLQAKFFVPGPAAETGNNRGYTTSQNNQAQDAGQNNQAPNTDQNNEGYHNNGQIVEAVQQVYAEETPTEAVFEQNTDEVAGPPRIHFFDDGTLLVHQMPETAACSYFVNLPNLPMRVAETPKRIHYHIEDCSDDHLGIELAEYYGHYLLANAAQVPFTMTCGVANEGEDSVLRRFQTDNEFPGPPPVDVAGHQYSVYDVCFACYGLSSWCDRGPELMVETFRQDMWKMANSPFGQSLESEDAVVHLRLGDALKAGRDEGTGLLPFRSYSRLLKRVENESGPLATISVVTQTFDPSASRENDIHSLERSELVAKDFIVHLRETFPHAVVVLRNSPADTPFVTYVRIMKANKVTICGATTFCTYAALSNPAISYLFESEKLNPWVKRLRYLETVRTYDTPRLASNYAGSLTDNQLLHWLRHQDPNGSDVITSPPLFRVPKTKFMYQ